MRAVPAAMARYSRSRRRAVSRRLYSFAGGSDGQNPNGGLIMDGSGNLYGVTESGGSDGSGTVFRID